MTDFTKLIIFSLSGVGLTFAVSVYKIGYPVRAGWLYACRSIGAPKTLEEFIYCPACVGFWIGVAGSFALSPSSQFVQYPISLMYDGLINSTVAFIIYTWLVEKPQIVLETEEPKKDGDNAVIDDGEDEDE